MLRLSIVHWIVFGATYSTFALITFGHLLVNGRPGWKRRLIQLVASALWPAYWLVTHGVVGTSRVVAKACIELIHQLTAVFRAIGVLNKAIIEFMVFLLEPIGSAWAVGVVVFPVYYVATYWNACESNGCLAVLGRACLWAPFWMVYWAMYYHP